MVPDPAAPGYPDPVPSAGMGPDDSGYPDPVPSAGVGPDDSGWPDPIGPGAAGYPGPAGDPDPTGAPGPVGNPDPAGDPDDPSAALSELAQARHDRMVAAAGLEPARELSPHARSVLDWLARQDDAVCSGVVELLQATGQATIRHLRDPHA